MSKWKRQVTIEDHGKTLATLRLWKHRWRSCIEWSFKGPIWGVDLKPDDARRIAKMFNAAADECDRRNAKESKDAKDKAN